MTIHPARFGREGFLKSGKILTNDESIVLATPYRYTHSHSGLHEKIQKGVFLEEEAALGWRLKVFEGGAKHRVLMIGSTLCGRSELHA